MSRNLKVGSYQVENPSVWFKTNNKNGLVYEPKGELGNWYNQDFDSAYWPRPNGNSIRLLGGQREVILLAEVNELIRYFGDAIIEAAIKVGFDYIVEHNNEPVTQVNVRKVDGSYVSLINRAVKKRLIEVEKVLYSVDRYHNTKLFEVRRKTKLAATKVILDGYEVAI